VKHNPFNPHVHALLSAAVDTLGPEQVLPLLERLVVRALSSESESRSLDESVAASDSLEHLPAKGPNHTAFEQQLVSPKRHVLGLPDGYTWNEAPVVVKLAKTALRSAMAEPHGVVLRHEDSAGGDLYYAVYDHGSKTFQVPAGYRTSRGPAAEIAINGAYRWLLVGVARAVTPKSRCSTKGQTKATVNLPKWRGRQYEPCHEEMAHSGNVRAGSLVRNTQTGTLDYVAECDGRTALIERENGDLDDFKLSAQPSKLLRVVGYSSQYAEEVAARG